MIRHAARSIVADACQRNDDLRSDDVNTCLRKIMRIFECDPICGKAFYHNQDAPTRRFP